MSINNSVGRHFIFSVILFVLEYFSRLKTNVDAKPHFQIPPVEIKVFSPKGFEVSIPDHDGIELFAFHCKLNQEMNGLETGTWSEDILKPRGNRFVFSNPKAKLQVGDILHFWYYVQNNGLRYQKVNQQYRVTEYTNFDDDDEFTVHSLPSNVNNRIQTNDKLKRDCLRNGVFTMPKAKFEVLSPKGFQVSIPALDGISLFAFHGKLNEEMEDLEAGVWSKDILRPSADGSFIFRDRETLLRPGDIIYYWTFAIHNGLGYREDDGKFIVSRENHISEIPFTTEIPLAFSTGERKPSSSLISTTTGRNVIDQQIDQTTKNIQDDEFILDIRFEKE